MKFYAGLIAMAMVAQCWALYPNGPSSEGNVDAATLLAWIKAHETSANVAAANAFANRDGDAKNITLYQLGGGISNGQPTFWESNMDVDCDGSNSGACNGFDPSHQSTLSCNCQGTVDADVLSYYVIPGCSDCTDCGGTWGPFAYNQRGIGYGQVAACIYKTGSQIGIAYAVFLDEDGCNTEIGEGSAQLNRFLGINPDPDNGGSESGNAYIIFPGSNNRISDYANHAHAVTVGQAAAAALIGTPINQEFTTFKNTSSINYQITKRTISISSDGSHSISIFDTKGDNVLTVNGMGAQKYELSNLRSGSYVAKIGLQSGVFFDKIVIY